MKGGGPLTLRVQPPLKKLGQVVRVQTDQKATRFTPVRDDHRRLKPQVHAITASKKEPYIRQLADEKGVRRQALARLGGSAIAFEPIQVVSLAARIGVP